MRSFAWLSFAGLPLTLHASVAPLESMVTEFEVVTCAESVTIRGQLTAGSRGWALKAEAACRRSTITMNVTAFEVEPMREPDLEHHRYEATIRVRRTGRYMLRVAHAYVLRGERGMALPKPVFETTFRIP